jgi:hypothetical protein
MRMGNSDIKVVEVGGSRRQLRWSYSWCLALVGCLVLAGATLISQSLNLYTE